MVDAIRSGKVTTVTKGKAIGGDKPKKSKNSGEERPEKDAVPDEAHQPKGGRIDERC